VSPSSGFLYLPGAFNSISTKRPRTQPIISDTPALPYGETGFFQKRPQARSLGTILSASALSFNLVRYVLEVVELAVVIDSLNAARSEAIDLQT
jgi:hypothetical protein